MLSFLINLERNLITDSDIVANIVIRILLYSSAFQHASTQSRVDQIYRRMSDLAHRKVVSAVIDLSAEMRRLRENHKAEADMANIVVGDIICFEHEYFCKHILTQVTFPVNQSCKSNLNIIVELLFNISTSNVKSCNVEGKHHFIFTGKFNEKSRDQKKQFWVLFVNVREFSCFCVEYAKKFS